jgi:hypothetical protein
MADGWQRWRLCWWLAFVLLEQAEVGYIVDLEQAFVLLELQLVGRLGVDSRDPSARQRQCPRTARGVESEEFCLDGLVLLSCGTVDWAEH